MRSTIHWTWDPGGSPPKGWCTICTAGIHEHGSGESDNPGVFALTLANSASQQFSELTSGFEPLSNDVGSISFYTAELSGLLSVTDATAGVCVGESDGINCCVRRFNTGLVCLITGQFGARNLG